MPSLLAVIEATHISQRVMGTEATLLSVRLAGTKAPPPVRAVKEATPPSLSLRLSHASFSVWFRTLRFCIIFIL